MTLPNMFPLPSRVNPLDNMSAEELARHYFGTSQILMGSLLSFFFFWDRELLDRDILDEEVDDWLFRYQRSIHSISIPAYWMWNIIMSMC